MIGRNLILINVALRSEFEHVIMPMIRTSEKSLSLDLESNPKIIQQQFFKLLSLEPLKPSFFAHFTVIAHTLNCSMIQYFCLHLCLSSIRLLVSPDTSTCDSIELVLDTERVRVPSIFLLVDQGKEECSAIFVNSHHLARPSHSFHMQI